MASTSVILIMHTIPNGIPIGISEDAYGPTPVEIPIVLGSSRHRCRLILVSKANIEKLIEFDGLTMILEKAYTN